MSWIDRVKPGSYTSPSGVSIPYQFENLSRSFEKKTAAFNSADSNGTKIQDNGNTGRQYPIRVYFSGDDHDLEANAFDDALHETGPGVLNHPFYNINFSVVPFGKINQRDDLKTAANQTIFDVVFFETLDASFTTAQQSASSNVISSVEEFNTAISEEFDENILNNQISQQTSLAGYYTTVLDAAGAALKPIADTQEGVSSTFNTVFASINQGIDTLVADPLTLAFQTAILMQAPSRALTSIGARLDAYRNLLSQLISGEPSAPDLNGENSNNFQTNRAYASMSITGSILSVVNNQFETKTQALEAAEEIIGQMDAFTNWNDDNYESLGEIDTGAAYQQLQEAVAVAAGFLVEISFTLKQERRITLGGPRNIVELCAELYGEVDEKIDFLINSNDLTGEEILEIPRGRAIVYYV